MKKLYIGTSGWSYYHWGKIFYPENLKNTEKIKYFSKFFNTTEINYSFYHMPKPQTYKNWYNKTPDEFLFAIKISRFITHIKRLKGIRNYWISFLKNAMVLGQKMGPFLLQLPSTFKSTKENLKRIENFFQIAIKPKISLAIEVRDKSFRTNIQFFEILKKYNTALVISDSSKWAKIEKPNLANFIYIRMHGPKSLFLPKYTKKELRELAQKIKKWQTKKDVFVYFNNDAFGFAIENALFLKKII